MAHHEGRRVVFCQGAKFHGRKCQHAIRPKAIRDQAGKERNTSVEDQMNGPRWFKHDLPPEADKILDEVLEAMQQAEEMGSPEGPAYVLLMLAIAAECNVRAKNCVNWSWRPK